MKSKIILIVLLTSVVLFACKKEVGEFLLGGYKVYNPMSGNETLLFLSTSGDTIMFYGDGRYSELIETSEGDGDDYWVNEIDYCSFTTKDEKYALSTVMATYKDRAVEMDLKYYEQVGIDTFYFAWSPYSLPPSEEMTPPKIYIDSLLVLDQYYFGVYADYRPGSPISPTTEIEVIAIYYTVDEGIIRIDFEDDTYWGLTEIISQ